jgi:DNA-binding CsgD family transcriptional regulator
MVNKLQDKNQSQSETLQNAINGLRQNTGLIAAFCQPLFRTLCAKHFSYIEFFSEGTYTVQGTDVPYLEEYIRLGTHGTYFPSLIKRVPPKESRSILWDTNQDDPVCRLQKKFGYDNGLTVCYRDVSKRSIRCYNFVLKEDQKTLFTSPEVYSDAFKNFATHFYNQFEGIFESTAKARLDNGDDMGYEVDTLQERLDHFLTYIRNKRFSQREIQCLTLLSQGLTTKEMGQELDLSHRTVEYYIQNMKNKHSKKRTQDLLTFFKNPNL